MKSDFHSSNSVLGYGSFGSPMPNRNFVSSTDYRYGFNGKEKDDEIKGDGASYDYGMRIYDPRLGRFLSVDPITDEYPELTPYQFASNTPVWADDLDGLEARRRNSTRTGRDFSGVSSFAKLFGASQSGKYFHNLLFSIHKKQHAEKRETQKREIEKPEERLIESTTEKNYHIGKDGLYHPEGSKRRDDDGRETLPHSWSDPKDDDVDQIEELGELNKDHRIEVVEVQVNTNLRRKLFNKKYNKALDNSNEQRKNSVIEELVDAGIPRNKIRVRQTRFGKKFMTRIKATLKPEKKEKDK